MSGIGGDVCEAHACRREVATAAWIACADMYVHWALRAFSMLTAHSVGLYSIWMCVCVCVVSCRVMSLAEGWRLRFSSSCPCGLNFIFGLRKTGAEAQLLLYIHTHTHTLCSSWSTLLAPPPFLMAKLNSMHFNPS